MQVKLIGSHLSFEEFLNINNYEDAINHVSDLSRVKSDIQSHRLFAGLQFPADFYDSNFDHGEDILSVIENICSSDPFKVNTLLMELSKELLTDISNHTYQELCTKVSPEFIENTLFISWRFLCTDENLSANTSNDIIHCFNYSIPLDPGSEEEFIFKLDSLLEKVTFHKDVKDSLSTIKGHSYKEFSKGIVSSLIALNQSYSELLEIDNNQQRCLKISEKSREFGRQFQCSRQGSRKPKYDFSDKGKGSKLNCEYHLKVNFLNDDSKVEKDNYLRIYFSLENEGHEQLFIGLAHIGKHL